MGPYSPVSDTTDVGLTPLLTASIKNAHAGYLYLFTYRVWIPDGKGSSFPPNRIVAQSPPVGGAWSVPAGVLHPGQTYGWNVSVEVRPNPGDPNLWLSGPLLPYDYEYFTTSGPESFPPPPHVAVQSPADQSIVRTQQPTLKVAVENPSPGIAYDYTFSIRRTDGVALWSLSTNAPEATVPANILFMNQTYVWTVSVKEPGGFLGVEWPIDHTLFVASPISPGAELSESQPHDHGVNLATGRLELDGPNPSPVAGVPAGTPGLDLHYSSGQQSVRSAFGTGWTSLLDVRTADRGSGRISVTLPAGGSQDFLVQPDGLSYAGPPGISGYSLHRVPDTAAYELTGPRGTTYVITPDGLTEVRTGTGSTLKVMREGGRPTSIQDLASGLTLKIAWTPEGLVASIMRSRGSQQESSGWTFAYTAGLLVSSCEPDNGLQHRCTQYAYDQTTPGSPLTSLTRPTGGVTQITYANGLVSSVTDAAKSVWRYVHASPDQTQISDPLNNASTFQFQDGHLIRRTDALGHSETIDYDPFGRPTVWGAPKGTSIRLGYDTDGNILSRETYFSNQLVTSECYKYAEPSPGKAKQLVARIDPRQLFSCLYASWNASGPPLERYTYDSSGRMLSSSVGAEDSPPTTSYSYTAGTAGAPAGLLASVTSPMGEVVRYEYGPDGFLQSETNARGGRTVYTRDWTGRVTSISRVVSGEARATALSWNDDDSLRTSTEAKTVDSVSGIERQLETAYRYDANGDPVERTLTNVADASHPSLSLQRFDRDVMGRVRYVYGAGGIQTQSFGYDTRGLLGSTIDALKQQIIYSYDAAGNRTSATARRGAPNSQFPIDVRLAEWTYDELNHVSSMLDQRGQRWRIESDAAGRVTTRAAIDATGKDLWSETTTYDALGNTVSSQGPRGSTWYTYDGHGRLTLSATTSQRKETSYDADGRPIRSSIASATGAVDTFSRWEYDACGDVVLEASGRSSDERVIRYSYDEAGELTDAFDPRTPVGDTAVDRATSYSYYPDGRLREVRAPKVEKLTTVSGAQPTSDGRPTARRGYDAFGRLNMEVDVEGRTWEAHYDANSRVDTVTHPRTDLADGTTVSPQETYSYDAAGNVTRHSDVAGQTETYTYDSYGHQISHSFPSPTAKGKFLTSRTYWDQKGLQVATADERGVVTRNVYDSFGNLTKTSTTADGGVSSRSFTYDAAGRVTSETLPMGGVQNYAYYPDGSLAIATDADGIETQYSYDAVGRRTRSQTSGVVTVAEYDGVGNLVKQTRQSTAGDIATTDSFEHDPAGNVTAHIDGAGATTRFLYDSLSHVTQVRDPAGATKDLSVTPTGLIASVRDARGNETTYRYTGAGAVAQVQEPATTNLVDVSSRTWSFGYDTGGHLTKIVEPGGVVHTRDVTAGGLLVSETAAGPSASSAARSFTYDDFGDLTSENASGGVQQFTYDSLGRLVKSTGPLGDSSSAFDLEGRVVSQALADKSLTTSWTAGGRLHSTQASGSNVRTFEYAGDGNLSAETFGDAVHRSISRDGIGRITHETVSGPGGPIYDWSGSYNAKSQLVTASVSRGPGATTQSRYSYDAASRLTEWTLGDGVTHSARYDSAGNRIQVDGVVSTFDERNRVTSTGAATFDWSARGDLLSTSSGGATHRYTWDGLGRLTASGASTYKYDDLDRLIDDSGTRCLYTGNSLEPSTCGSQHWDRLGTALLSEDGRLPVLDAHGSLLGSVSATGEFSGHPGADPFGRSSAQGGAPGQTLGFQGQWVSGDGLVHMQSRWYEPDMGQFLSRDGGRLPLSALNRYQYADSDPVNRTDPSGRYAPGPAFNPDWARALQALAEAGETGAEVGSVEPGGGTLLGFGLGVTIAALTYGGIYGFNSAMEAARPVGPVGPVVKQPLPSNVPTVTDPARIPFNSPFEISLPTLAAGIPIPEPTKIASPSLETSLSGSNPLADWHYRPGNFDFNSLTHLSLDFSGLAGWRFTPPEFDYGGLARMKFDFSQIAGNAEWLADSGVLRGPPTRGARQDRASLGDLQFPLNVVASLEPHADEPPTPSRGIDRGDGRDEWGRFTGTSGAGYGKDREAEALQDLSIARGTTVETQQVRATLPPSVAQNSPQEFRYYDGLLRKPDGTYLGIEIKSGTAGRTRGQDIFDGLVTPATPARAHLRGQEIEITEVEVIFVPA